MTSLASRRCCAALRRAPHNTLAWVQTTPFGREVVPVVNMMDAGANGSGARRSAGSPNRASKRSLLAGWFPIEGAVPASSAVTASHRRPRQCSATSDANFGCVMAATALVERAYHSSSAPAACALVPTQTAPIHAQAKRASSISGQFSRCTRTRSPDLMPRRDRPPARHATSCMNRV